MAVMLLACGRNKKVDVSNIPVNISISRFDHDFDDMRTKPMYAQAQYLQKKYGSFYQDYIERILQAGSIRDTGYFKTLRIIFANQDYMALKHEVDSVYPNLNLQTEQLTDAFRRIKYNFPKIQAPAIYAYFSGFRAQTSLGDNYYGIGLDQFLGANSKFYPAIIEDFPHYISRRFTPDNIAPRVIEGFIRENMFQEPDADRSLLDKMVYNGKIMYMLDQVLPDTPDTLKIGYTEQQQKWAEDFKGQVWAYFLGENLLYETDNQKISKFINEAPFTPALGEHNESAPKLGVWTGWQIVRQYMDRHPEVTLAQLMANNDAQKILNESRYKPK
jgi:gliding motility-associated lipoprotein GldB